MNILKIAREIAYLPVRAVKSVLWHGRRISYGIICIPKKFYCFCATFFKRTQTLPPTQPISNPSNPSLPIQKIESPTEQDEPKTPKQEGENYPIEGQGSSGSFENVQEPGLTKPPSDPEIFESVEVTKNEAAPGLLADQSKTTGLWALIFGGGSNGK